MRRTSIALALGLGAGFVGGLFGVGGGVVMVPGMVVLMSVAQHTAHGTSVAAIIASATAGAVRLGLAGEVDWDTAGVVLVGAMIGAFFGARLMHRIPAVWLARAFVVISVVAALRMALQPEITGTLLADRGILTGVGFVVLGLLAGTLAAILGVGGGIVYVPALVALFAFEQHIAQGTSLAIIVPSMVVAAVTHSRAGRVDWRLGGILGIGGVLGGVAGAQVALSLDAALLRQLFAGFLVVMVMRMLNKTRASAHG